jgi:predicted nuclease of predicted toxin-antitoxin system
MNLYLDDDSVDAVLIRLLRQAGHDVQIPADVGTVGEDDSVHLAHAIRQDRLLLSHNHRDFRNLHNLVMQAQGHHPGILIVRKDNDPTRDLKPPGIVRAIRNLEQAAVPLRDEYHILNQWR